MKKIEESPKDYTSNNIDFRIISSKLLERYKATQNFVLTEMKYGQYNFSRTSRELAILYTDNSFKGLLDIESFFIRSHEKILTEDMAKEVVSLLLARMGYLYSVVKYHKSIFDSVYIELWDKVHFQITRMVERVIEGNVGADIDVAYTELVAILLDSADAIRFELYEIDYIANNREKPFLVVTNMCIMASRELGTNVVASRAKVYEDFFKAKIDFTVKDYTDSLSAFDVCVSGAIDKGISIVNRDGALYGTK